MAIDLSALSNDDLRAILLTVDGQGRVVKGEAIALLEERAYQAALAKFKHDQFIIATE